MNDELVKKLTASGTNELVKKQNIMLKVMRLKMINLALLA